MLVDGASFKCGNSQHPLDDVTRGEKLLKDVYEMIRRSPHWSTSLLVVLYDEHGGFFDHVAPPPAPPPGDRAQPGNNHHKFAFDQLGVRVPALVVSPHTPRGLIDHTVYDHSSLLATLERLWRLEPLTNRDAQAASFGHLFGLPQPRDDTPAALPEPTPSGLPDCEDSLQHRIAGELEELPSQLSGPVESTLVGFIQVAIARDLYLAAAVHRDLSRAVEQERDRLLTLYEDIRNKFDAARYLHAVTSRYREHRGGDR